MTASNPVRFGSHGPMCKQRRLLGRERQSAPTVRSGNVDMAIRCFCFLFLTLAGLTTAAAAPAPATDQNIMIVIATATSGTGVSMLRLSFPSAEACEAAARVLQQDIRGGFVTARCLRTH